MTLEPVSALGFRVERIQALALALLHDLAAWLEDARQPMQHPDYRLPRPIADLPDPPQRLAAYLNPSVLGLWRTTLEPWRRAGYGYQPRFDHLYKVRITALATERPKAVLHFKDRSTIEHGDLRQDHDRDWTMTLTVALEPGSIEAVELEADPELH